MLHEKHPVKAAVYTTFSRWGNDVAHGYGLRIRYGSCHKAGGGFTLRLNVQGLRSRVVN